MKYCKYCQRYVQGSDKKFSWGLFFFLLICLFPVAFIYMAFNLLFRSYKRNICPICNAKL